MAAPISSPLEKNQVSTSVSAEESPAFFKKHGVFYQANAAIGTLAREIDTMGLGVGGYDLFKELLREDPRAKSVLGDLLDRKPLQHFSIGSDKGHYFASTPEVTDGERDRLLIYMWSGNLELLFFDKSHEGSIKALPSPNGRFEVPFPAAKKSYGDPVPMEMEEGGFMIVQPRFIFTLNNGFSQTYSW